MQRMLLAILTATLVARAGLAGEAPDDQGLFTIDFQKIADDVYVASRPEPLRFMVEGNVTIIVNDRDVVVVDASGTPETARKVIAGIRKLSSRPVRYLVNTHGHGDHTVGNQEYLRAFPGVEIVGHPETLAYLTGRGIGYVAEIAASTESRKADGQKEIARVLAERRPGADRIVANLRQYYEHDIDLRQAAYREVTITPPTLIVEDALTLRRGERTIEVRFLGQGDTRGDLVVLLPRERILVTGDLVVHPVPYGFSRQPLEWRQTLERLAALPFDVLVPGHGDVQHGSGYLRQLMALLDTTAGAVREGREHGRTAAEVRAGLDAAALGAAFAGGNPVFQYFFEQYFLDPNVERTWAELAAQP
jgi:glyoxylase-like metal-dependent hydrolase (beta-lactamase superfamily II)